MNSNSQFDFLIDKDKKTITVIKEFAADKNLVWDVYTKSEYLDQWFAPKPWMARTKVMNFTEGGYWLYAMCGPAGEEHWGRMDYEKITPKESYMAWDGFCDAEGVINAQLPRAKWESLFSEHGENTIVKTTVTYNSLNDLETVINMGMQEGIAKAIVGLEELITHLKTTKMYNNLLFDFTVDKATKTVFITREFDADLSLVWDAFTKAELLDEWTAPKPWASKTKYQDFKVGSKRFYAMVSPEGYERWAIQEYTSITPKTNFKMYNAFADKDENPELPGSEWDYSFSEQDGITKVSITIYNESLARMEKMIEMGFTEGFKMSMANLENLLATLSKK